MRAIARWCAAVVLLAPAGCATYISGDYLEHTARLSGAGRSSFAFHVAVVGLYDAAGGGYDGTVVNRSTDVDCTAAFYRFREPPSQAELPVLHAGDRAPAELPGGGVLMAQHALPRSGERRFIVPVQGSDYWIRIGDSEYGDPTIDEWVVGLTCPEADLAIELDFAVLVDREGREPPVLEPTWLEQVW